MAEKITKTEAVRRALNELGNNAMPVAIRDWVKDKLQIEMTAGHVSTTKGQLLRDAAKEDAAPLPTAPVAEDPQTLTEKEMPVTASVPLKTNKGKILHEAEKKPAAKKPASVKPTVAPEPKAQPSPAKPSAATANGKGIRIEDIQTLNSLLKRVGPETLRTLIGVMGK